MANGIQILGAKGIILIDTFEVFQSVNNVLDHHHARRQKHYLVTVFKIVVYYS